MVKNMNYRPLIFRSDNELKTKSVLRWLAAQGIMVETSAPNTPAQNGRAERSGGVIMEKARVMRIGANLPEGLETEVIAAAIYIHNLTPKHRLGWVTPHEKLRGWKSKISHLKAYGCKVFALTPDAQLRRNRSAKLDPKAAIGFLVGYQSSNIFRIWLPALDKVISTRDVIFDEDTIYSESSIQVMPPSTTTEEIAERIQEKEWSHPNVWETLSPSTEQSVLSPASQSLLSLNGSTVLRPDEVDNQPSGSLRVDSLHSNRSDTRPNPDILVGDSVRPPFWTVNQSQSGSQVVDPERPELVDNIPSYVQSAVRGLGRNLSDQLYSDPLDSTGVSGDSSTGTSGDSDFWFSEDGSTYETVFSPAQSETTVATHSESPSQICAPEVNLTVEESPEFRREVLVVVGDESKQDIRLVIRTRTSMVPDWLEPYGLGGEFSNQSEHTVFLTTFAQGAVALTSALPPPPRAARDLAGHKYQAEFEAAMKDHLKSHEELGTFEVVNRNAARGHRILPAMWVFAYKTKPDGSFDRCKARMVACGNQQEQTDLMTRATTLGGPSLRILFTLAAFFDLEIRQLDITNAFVNADLDEEVYMWPPGENRKRKDADRADRRTRVVWRLKKALYGLRRSPVLWQKHLKSLLSGVGLTPLGDEPDILISNKLIVAIYVDDILLMYHERHASAAAAVLTLLRANLKLREMGEPEQFLSLQIYRHRRSKTLWINQSMYIEKIANRFLNTDGLDQKKRIALPDASAFHSHDDQASTDAIRHYQQKTGSLLYAAVQSRPDVAFIVARLCRHNANPSPEHDAAADRVLTYLFQTRYLGLGLGGAKTKEDECFTCDSDASFADNVEDRKSTHGFVMRLLGGTISWRSGKQSTVTTSTTEAELLALSTAAKEVLFTERILKGLGLRLDNPTVIHEDNLQTLRLVCNEAVKLITQLRHVDVNSHWLREAVQQQRILIEWVPTNEMRADGMTKQLAPGKQDNFLRQLGLKDIELSVKNREARKSREHQTDSAEHFVLYTRTLDLRGRLNE